MWKSEKLSLGNSYSSSGKGQYFKYVQVDPLGAIKRSSQSDQDPWALIQTRSTQGIWNALWVVLSLTALSVNASVVGFLPEMGMQLSRQLGTDECKGEQIQKNNQIMF